MDEIFLSEFGQPDCKRIMKKIELLYTRLLRMEQITRGLCQLLTIVAEDDSSYINISISKVSVSNLQSAFRNKVRWLKLNLHNINKIEI